MRSPNWVEDEVMLTLDLYLNKGLGWAKKVSDTTFEIVALSHTLNSLDLHPKKPENFRSTGSIRMKFGNFMELDDEYKKNSLSNVSAVDRTVWDLYAKNPLDLHVRCKDIIEKHLIKHDENIDKYLESMELDISRETALDTDFKKFSNKLIRVLSYYEKCLEHKTEFKYKDDVIKSCKEIRQALQWTNNISENIIISEDDYVEHAGINLKPVNSNNKGSESNEEKEKIGKYIHRSFWKLVDAGKIDDELIDKLKATAYSKTIFGIKPSFLIEVDISKPIAPQVTDINGYVRYWTKPIQIKGVNYCVCKEWFENQRERYENWMKSVDKKLFYMISENELQKILLYLKNMDSKRTSILRKDIYANFPEETTEEVLSILINMPLGWIDFSKTERSKVLSVLDMLTEQGTLDELGIAPIRDGFANLFFPGTSTIQTRAKYFFAVPYACKDMEKSSESNPARALIALDAVERNCGEKFLSINKDEAGVMPNRGWFITAFNRMKYLAYKELRDNAE